MKPLTLLAAIACLLFITSPLAAKPKANQDGVNPQPGQRKPADKLRAKAGGEGKAGLQQKILQEFDANGNGKLDPDEQAAARKAAAERRKQRKQKGDPANAPDPLNQPDGLQPLDGQPLGGGGGAGQRGNGRAKLLERFDLNRDGMLSPQEEARAREMMQKHGGPGAVGGGLPPGLGPKKPRGQFKQ